MKVTFKSVFRVLSIILIIFVILVSTKIIKNPFEAKCPVYVEKIEIEDVEEEVEESDDEPVEHSVVKKDSENVSPFLFCDSVKLQKSYDDDKTLLSLKEIELYDRRGGGMLLRKVRLRVQMTWWERLMHYLILIIQKTMFSDYVITPKHNILILRGHST